MFQKSNLSPVDCNFLRKVSYFFQIVENTITFCLDILFRISTPILHVLGILTVGGSCCMSFTSNCTGHLCVILTDMHRTWFALRDELRKIHEFYLSSLNPERPFSSKTSHKLVKVSLPTRMCYSFFLFLFTLDFLSFLQVYSSRIFLEKKFFLVQLCDSTLVYEAQFKIVTTKGSFRKHIPIEG